MTRDDILKSLTDMGLTRQQAILAVDTFFESIADALKEGQTVSIVGFGSWEWRTRKGRTARNPKTGQKIAIADRKVLFFKPSKLLKEKLKVPNP